MFIRGGNHSSVAWHTKISLRLIEITPMKTSKTLVAGKRNFKKLVAETTGQSFPICNFLNLPNGLQAVYGTEHELGKTR